MTELQYLAHILSYIYTALTFLGPYRQSIYVFNCKIT